MLKSDQDDTSLARDGFETAFSPQLFLFFSAKQCLHMLVAFTRLVQRRPVLSGDVPK